jgi:hypothetical protein
MVGRGLGGAAPPARHHEVGIGVRRYSVRRGSSGEYGLNIQARRLLGQPGLAFQSV